MSRRAKRNSKPSGSPRPSSGSNRQSGKHGQSVRGARHQRFARIAALTVVVGALAWLIIQRPWNATDRRSLEDRIATLAAAPSAVDDTGNNEPVSSGQTSDDGTPLSSRFTNAKIEAQRFTLDPARTGWDTEVFHELAAAQLKALAHALEGPRAITVEDVNGLVEPVFTCSHLRPETEQLQRAYRDELFEVLRSADDDIESAPFKGPAGFVEALSALQTIISSGKHTHVKLKQFRIEPGPDTVSTTVILRASTTASAGPRQINSTWRCRWTGNDQSGPPRLLSIAVLDYEEIRGHGLEAELFRDDTHAVLGETPFFDHQLSHGLDYWLQRVGRLFGMTFFARNGLAVGDADGDGRDDVYVCQAGGLPNRLFVQRGDRAVDVSQAAGVDFFDHSSSALFVDIDNDGDQDLAVAMTAGLVVLENQGRLKFATVARLSTLDHDVQSLTATDYDLDGDLDLYLCMDFGTPSARPDETPPPFTYHDANDGGANLLFRNEGRGKNGKLRFVDVTRECGLDQDNRRHSLAASWEDYDNDGDPDLYVANDYGRNCLYRNDDGRFINIADRAGVVDYGSGMSAAWGDYDRDGNPDLYVANMFSSAGNRITRQEQFQIDQAGDDETLALYQRFAKGNSLFRNLGDSKFEEVSSSAGVEIAGWAWGSIFVDVNNDGWEDLLVGNGYITTEDTGDL